MVSVVLILDNQRFGGPVEYRGDDNDDDEGNGNEPQGYRVSLMVNWKTSDVSRTTSFAGLLLCHFLCQ